MLMMILIDNYIVAGALDGGTQVISFILNLAVFGAAGPAVAVSAPSVVQYRHISWFLALLFSFYETS